MNALLCLIQGAPCMVDHHYKSKKMGLWLELLPQIHRPDSFDPIYHLLDDFDNLTSFEEFGTRKIDLRELRALRPVTIPTTSPSTYTNATILSLRLTVHSTPRSRRTTGWFTETLPFSSPSPSVTHQTVVGGDDDPSRAESRSSSTASLGATVAVGATLLLLNLVVFAAAYCQWKRLSRSRSARKLEHTKMLAEVEYVGTRLRHTDADCSTAFENHYSSRALMNCGNNVDGGEEKRGGCQHYNNRYHKESVPLQAKLTAAAAAVSTPSPHSYAMLATACDGSPRRFSTLPKPPSALLKPPSVAVMVPVLGTMERDVTPSPSRELTQRGRSTSIDSDLGDVCNHSEYSTTVV